MGSAKLPLESPFLSDCKWKNRFSYLEPHWSEPMEQVIYLMWTVVEITLSCHQDDF